MQVLQRVERKHLLEHRVYFTLLARRIQWFGGEGRVGLRFAVIDPALFEQLQHWTNKKMKDEGWELPA